MIANLITALLFALTFYVIYKLLIEIRYLQEEIDIAKHDVYLLQDQSTALKTEIEKLQHSITISQEELAYFDTHIKETRKTQDSLFSELMREAKKALNSNEKIELDIIKEIESSNLAKNEEFAEIKNSKNVKPKKNNKQKT